MTQDILPMVDYGMYIGGTWQPSHSGKTFESFNPATGRVWATLAEADEADVDRAVRVAHDTFQSPAWRSMTPSTRGRLLWKLADLIEENTETLARLESQDNGKLIRETLGQVRYIPEFFRYYAGMADKIAGATLPIDKPDMFTYTLREPLGVIAAIVPWNSPLYLTAIKLAPALAAGNTVVLKPSEHASATILELARLVTEAGFPAGTVNVVTGFGQPTGDALTRHPLVRKIVFTGGETAARSVLKNAAQNLAQTSLELGGKSPNIIFDDANLESAVNGAVAGIFAACGQSCVAGSRLLVQAAIYDDFMELFKGRAERIRIGDPLDPGTEMGPMATKAQLDTVDRFVREARQQGVAVVHGGQVKEAAEGWYFEPTILACQNQNAQVVRREIFGPVASVLKFEDEEQALGLANDTDYGLAAGIWTMNLARAHRLIRQIRAGIVWVNTYRAISPMAPIGGFGLSGYGREGGLDALHDFTETKTVWINTSDMPMPDPFVMR